MIRSYPIKLNPTPAQSAGIEYVLSTSSLYYNESCAVRKEEYLSSKKFIPNGKLEKLAITWKKSFDLLGQMHSHIVQDICKRNTLAYDQFFDRIKKRSKQAAGLPKPKAKPSKSFTLKQSGYSIIKSGNLISKIKFWKNSPLGSIKLTRKFMLPVGAKINVVHVIRKADGYYAILTCEVLAVQRTASKSAKIMFPHCLTTTNLVVKQSSTGVDMGIKDFITLKDGTQFNCAAIKLAEQKLDALNRAKNNKRKQHAKQNSLSANSRRYNKILEKIAKQHLKIARIRADFQNKVANYLLTNYDNIQIEDLNILRMIEKNQFGRRHMRNVHSASWGSFFNILNYKASLYNSNVNKVNPAYTSQMCACGAHVPKDLSVRQHECVACGASSNRDLMSAQVIEILGNANHISHKMLSEARAMLELKFLGTSIH